MVNLSPQATLTQLAALPIWRGAVCRVVVPSPNCPLPFPPQAQSVPSLLIAAVCISPSDTLDQFVAVPTWVGMLLLITLPMPNWPLLFAPQVHSFPSLLMAALWTS